MAVQEPGVRASYMKDLVSTLDQLGQRAELEAADPALFRDIAAASRLAWLPVALNVRLVEVIASRVGAERGIALLADCIYRQLDAPLWKSFVGGAIRLLGTEPGLLGRFLPEAIRLVFRGCGRFRVENTGEAELTLHAEDLPAALAAHRLWLRSLATGLTPLFLLCGCDGTSELVEANEGARTARYVLRWKAD